ncbi:MAG: 50S ribosomal protein L10 [Nanoarchaeota archaeon]
MIPENYTPKINKRNQLYAQKIKDLSNKYSIVGVVDITGLPALQFQRIRASLKGTAEVLIVKKNIVEIVLNELSKKYNKIEELKKQLNGITGLIFTNDNPFSLYQIVKKSKSTAPAKKGSIAPKDIYVKAGPTGFAPGPIIGELGAFKIKAGINAGKVEIKEDSLVVKEGDIISSKLAEILTRLAIEPMEVGLNIKGIYENGLIYQRDILDVDVEQILDKLKSASTDSFKLSIGLNYHTKDNINYFLGNNAKDALALAISSSYIAKETIPYLFSKANNQSIGVAKKLPQDIRPAGLDDTSSTVVEQNNVSTNEESKKEEETTQDPAQGFGSFF